MIPSTEVVNVADLRAQNARLPVGKYTDDQLRLLFLRCLLGWVNVRHLSQVCSRWRLVILPTPNFWRFIPRSPSFKWVQECIRRSVGAPFIEFDDVDAKIFDQVLVAYPDIIPRIRRLAGVISIKAWEQVLNDIQNPSAQLEELDLRDLKFAPDFPSQPLKHVQLPQLRRLFLSMSDVDLFLPILENVSDFGLSLVSFTRNQFASIIEKLPLLERLFFSLPQSSGLFRDEPNLPAISMPRLRYLKTENCGLLDHISIAPGCVLSSFGRFKDHTESVVKAITDRFIMNHTAYSNTHLSLEFAAESLAFNNRHRSFYGNDWTDEDHDSFHIDTERVHPKEWLPTVLKFMTDLVPILPSVTCFSFEFGGYDIEWALKHIIPFFRHLTGVKSLYFHHQHIGKLFSPLEVAYDEDDGAGTKIIFPSLETLHLSLYYFNLNAPLLLGDQLESYVSWRFKHGRPLKCIKGEYTSWNGSSFEQEYGNFARLLEGKYGVQLDFLKS